MQIWDTAGQERFRTITTSYFRGAQGILLVYDVTDRKSFDSISNWVNQLEQHADKVKQPHLKKKPIRLNNLFLFFIYLLLILFIHYLLLIINNYFIIT